MKKDTEVLFFLSAIADKKRLKDKILESHKNL